MAPIKQDVDLAVRVNTHVAYKEQTTVSIEFFDAMHATTILKVVMTAEEFAKAFLANSEGAALSAELNVDTKTLNKRVKARVYALEDLGAKRVYGKATKKQSEEFKVLLLDLIEDIEVLPDLWVRETNHGPEAVVRGYYGTEAELKRVEEHFLILEDRIAALKAGS